MVLEEKGKDDLLEKVQYSTDLANIFYVRQKEQKGLGHAIHTRQFIGNEPFAVLLGDDIVESETPYHQTIDERLRRNRSFSHWCSRSTRERYS